MATIRTDVDPTTGEIRQPQPTAEQVAVERFEDFLRAQADGELLPELAATMDELVAAVTVRGRRGTLTLTLQVGPGSRDRDTGLITGVKVVADVRAKLPRGEARESSWFIDHDGHVTQQHPRQQELPGLSRFPAR